MSSKESLKDNNNSNKKAKKTSPVPSAATEEEEQERKEIEILRNHIASCPNIPKDSRITKALLTTLDKERNRIERDAKLRKKFQAQRIDNSKTTPTKTTEDDIVEITHPEDDMEWQDIHPPQNDSSPISSNDMGTIGKTLAEVSISSMSTANITVSSPLSAIALALHSALKSDVLEFVCTGIPPPPSSSSGFAPPIRDLPKHVFIPEKWDEDPNRIAIRYRKDGLGVVVLRCSLEASVDEGRVSIQLGGEEPMLSFPLGDHVNLTSFQSALISSSDQRVKPALHYKALAKLFNLFCSTFDLGEQQPKQKELPYSSLEHVQIYQSTTTSAASPQISDFYPAATARDFPSDFGPDLHRPPLVNPPGNLMGPNHPMFTGGDDLVGPPSFGDGRGMRPQFDPYGPPGGPTYPGFGDGGRGRGRGRGRNPHFTPGADPNPDHLRPPRDDHHFI